MCEMGWRLARGVTPNFARCQPKKCEESPQKMRGVTPKKARSHPNASPGRIVWPQAPRFVRFAPVKLTNSPDSYTLILYFSPIQYWRNCRKICQTVSDRPKIMEKFSQPADENGHVLLPGVTPARSHPENGGMALTSFSKITLFQK